MGYKIDISLGKKTCPSCQTEKDFSFFGKDKHNRTGFTSSCKVCTKRKVDSNKALYARRRKQSRLKNLEKSRMQVRLNDYKKWGINITKEEYYEKLEEQGNLCAICNKPSANGKSLSLDHCHTTLKIRGFLCNNCNMGIAMFKENVSLLEKSLKYIEDHGE